jgi:hypothetical protein
VMADGGFDGIITNPPWESVESHAREFFAEHSDLVTKNKMNIKEFEKEQTKLLKNSEIRQAWLEFRSRFPHIRDYFRAAPQFSNQAPIIDGKKQGKDINLFKLFLEHSFHLLRPSGYCGLVIPSGIYADLGAKQLREVLFTQAQITGIFGFENRKEIFENVHRSFKFVVLTFMKGGRTDEFPVAFMRLNVEELTHFPETGGFRVTTDLIRRISPDSLSIPEFRDKADFGILEKVCRFPGLGNPVEGRWKVDIHREFNMTDDAHLFRTAPGKHRCPLYEGKMIHQFDHQFSEPRYWLDLTEARGALVSARLKSLRKMAVEHGIKSETKAEDLKLDYQSYRLAFRDVAASTNERTLIATILPPNVFCPHTMSMEGVFNDLVQDGRLRLNVPGLSGPERIYLAAILNSYVADYQLRQKVTNHLSFFFLYQLPVPRLTLSDATFGPIVQRAAQLICTTPEFDALAKEVSAALKLPLAAVKGVTETAARARLRAELDGLIAHLYGLTESEFAYILTTFPLVAENVKLMARNAFRDVQLGLIK